MAEESKSTRAEGIVATRSRDYTEEEVERGLHALALCSGNARKASKALAEKGLKVPRSTLQMWATRTHVDRYEQIHEHELAGIHRRQAGRNEELVDYLTDIEWKVAKRVENSLPDMRSDQAASALRNVAVAAAVNQDKALLLRGQPTAIREDRTVGELLRYLTSTGVVTVDPALLEGTAEEIPDARVDPDADD